MPTRRSSQPGGGDHRDGQRGEQRRDRRVEALDLVVSLTNALLGIAVDRVDGVLQVEAGDLARAEQQQSVDSQTGQEPTRDGVRSLDVSIDK